MLKRRTLEANESPANSVAVSLVASDQQLAKSEADVSIASARLLRPRVVAAMLSVTPSTLRTWRCSGRGPRFVRCSQSVIRYPSDALRSWLEEGAGPAT